MDIAHLFTMVTCITHTATQERGWTGKRENAESNKDGAISRSGSAAHDGKKDDREEGRERKRGSMRAKRGETMLVISDEKK